MLLEPRPITMNNRQIAAAKTLLTWSKSTWNNDEVAARKLDEEGALEVMIALLDDLQQLCELDEQLDPLDWEFIGRQINTRARSRANIRLCDAQMKMAA